MNRFKIRCCICGDIMKTLPNSSQDIIIDEETGEILYWNGQRCGYLTIEHLACEKCQEIGCN